MYFKSHKISLYTLLSFCIFVFTGCTTVKFVQPYDDALVTGVQKFYNSSALLIAEGKQNSPNKRPDKENIENMGHLIHFNKGYDLLMIEANLLVMRAMINSVKLDELGKKMQEKVTILIDEDFPSVCDGNSAELGDDFTSLTVENFADLKCVVSRWKTQHKLAPTKILTKGDWKRRHKTLISIVFAIQKAESFKQIEKTI